jgi:hypothetical protein
MTAEKMPRPDARRRSGLAASGAQQLAGGAPVITRQRRLVEATGQRSDAVRRLEGGTAAHIARERTYPLLESLPLTVPANPPVYWGGGRRLPRGSYCRSCKEPMT